MFKVKEEIAIKVENLTKDFKLPFDKATSLKSSLINFVTRKNGYKIQHALKDINVEIKKGEFFGIVGKNGGGKSTLLKLISGIYTPSKGNIFVNGKLTPFIELGVGFNPELTGRENVFLNGSLLGFNRKEMTKMYRDIVEFAELEDFMDQKLKNYSSGMQVRLAFSIAIRVQSDILIFDEVLAVGDENFQRKCLSIFNELKAQKKTIILVSHSTGDIEKFCDRVLVLDKGVSLGVYNAQKATSLYKEINFETDKVVTSKTQTNRWGTKELTIANINISGDHDKIKAGQLLKIEIDICAKKSKEDRPIKIGFAFYDEQGINLSGPNSNKAHFKFSAGKTKLRYTYTVKTNPLNEGNYNLTVALFDESQAITYDYWEKAVKFRVIAEETMYGKVILSGEWS